MADSGQPATHSRETRPTLEHPLKGVTVLDLGQVYNGPYCGFLLAQAGARVIKVEAPAGETLRARAKASAASYAFAQLNSNKECITLNVKSEAGQSLLKRLVRKADVLVENFAPGTLARYGVGSAALCGENPALIYAASTGFGATGPHRDYRGMDITLQAMTAVMSITGDGDGPPLKAGPALCDFLGGVHLYGAIVSALYRRARTGEGAVIDVSMQDCVLPTLSTSLGAYYAAGEQRPPTGNRHPALSAAPYNVYRASDGFVAIICTRDAHWANLCRLMERDDLITDERFASNPARCARMDEVDALVESWTTGRHKADIFQQAQNLGVICAPVQDLEDVMNDQHLHARGALSYRDHPVLGKVAMAQSALRFQGMTPLPLTDVPELGADTARVLADLADIDAEELAVLRKSEGV